MSSRSTLLIRGIAPKRWKNQIRIEESDDLGIGFFEARMLVWEGSRPSIGSLDMMKEEAAIVMTTAEPAQQRIQVKHSSNGMRAYMIIYILVTSYQTLSCRTCSQQRSL